MNVLRIAPVIGVLMLLAAIGPTALRADIINGNFEAPITPGALPVGLGFTSDYTPVVSNPAVMDSLWPDGTYTVGTNPHSYHSLWSTLGDHTSGTGNMLIVNGSTDSSKIVWKGANDAPLAAGKYQFSAWLAPVYPASPALVKFSFGAAQLGSDFMVSGPGWQEFTANFTIPPGSTLNEFDLVNFNLAYSGNDFAVDDIHLQAVPEPGILMLLGIMGGALQIGRRFKRF
jgi:hypothetical protein